MLRNYFLCYELSKYYDISLVTLQNPTEFVQGRSGYQWNAAIKVYGPEKKRENRGLVRKVVNAIKGRIYQRSLFRPANDFDLYGYPLIHQLLKKEKFDVIIFAHIRTLEIARYYRRYLHNTIKIIDAHNVDHLLYAAENDITIPLHRKEYDCIKKWEANIYRKADYFFACSEMDQQILGELNQQKVKGFVVPNGADTYRCLYHEDKDLNRKELLFCGSLDYLPNKEGLLWFHKEVWPLLLEQVPGIHLTVIGRNAERSVYKELIDDDTIRFVGEVDEVKDYYYDSTLCIAPLQKGSGTRLKILEAMSFGNPVVSTEKGAEGIAYTNGENICIANGPGEFAQQVMWLLQNPGRAATIRANARKLIDNLYSWEHIGQTLFYQLEGPEK